MTNNRVVNLVSIVYLIFFSCSILDDIEMYEQQKPFVLRDYILMSSFLNIFLYKGISQNLFGKTFVLFLL